MFFGYVAMFRGIFLRAGSSRIDWRASYQITMAGLAASRIFAAGGAGGLVLTAWALRRSGMPKRLVADKTLTLPDPHLWVTSYAAIAARRPRAASDTVAADPRPPAALARRRAARAPREHWPTCAVKRIEATNDAGYAAPIGLAADPVVFTLLDGRLSVLLARRLEEPQRGMFALPGGFVGAEESPEQTAERKLREKTGVGSVHLEQLRTYAEPERDPRGWLPSIAYLALVPPRRCPTQTPADRDASWHPLDALPELALDHARIVDDGLWRLRARVADKAWFMRVGGGLLPEEFTLARPSGSTRRSPASRSTRPTSAAT